MVPTEKGSFYLWFNHTILNLCLGLGLMFMPDTNFFPSRIKRSEDSRLDPDPHQRI
jgi:hypothetical protein